MNKFKTIFALIFLLVFSGCHTLKTNYQANTSVSINVDSNQYHIIGNINGEATYSFLYLGFLFLPIGDTREYGTFELPGGRFKTFGVAQQMATYNAIENSKAKYPGGVDAIITPKYTTKISGFPPFYTKIYAKVEGKGIKFKTKASKQKRK